MKRIVATVTAGVALFALGGLGLFQVIGSPGPAALTNQETTVLAARPLVAGASLVQTIAGLQSRLQAEPTDWKSFAALGLAYVQEARVTADPGYYSKAEGVLRRSLRLNGNENFDALTGLGALSLARHQFGGALDWGRRARDLNPYNANIRGVIGDALIELGRYPQAFRAFQEMVDLRPDLGSYARVSYARELQGDVGGAIRAMLLAVQAAGTSDDAAWSRYQLGELFFNSGRLAQAANSYKAARELSPSFVPPQAGLAKVAWARGQASEAIRRYSVVVERYPLPEYVIALGDLFERQGDEALARRQFSLARAEEDLFRAAGVNVDLELALFDADHGKLRAALRTARTEWHRRQSIHVADALAWALYRNGHPTTGLRFERRALALGTRSALFHFHAGMIELALGNRDGARRHLREAFDINPNFSIRYSPLLRRTLRTLA
jgi:tetratricopeptide (TPR) repeat protein